MFDIRKIGTLLALIGIVAAIGAAAENVARDTDRDLVAAIETGKPKMVASAMARYKSDRASSIATLQKLVEDGRKSGNQAQAADALRALGEMHAVEAVQFLIQYLDFEDTRVLQHKESTSTAFRYEVPSVFEMYPAVDALRTIGPCVSRSLLMAIASGKLSARATEQAAFTLGNLLGWDGFRDQIKEIDVGLPQEQKNIFLSKHVKPYYEH